MSEPIPHVLGELSTYLDRKLDTAETKRVEAHLKSCDACRQHYAELQTLRRMLQKGPSFTPPESFYQGVLHRIANSPRSGFGWGWGIPAKALASACVVMLVVWVTRETRKEKELPASLPLKGAAPQAANELQASRHAQIESLKNQPALDEKKALAEQESKQAFGALAERKREEDKAVGGVQSDLQAVSRAQRQLKDNPEPPLEKRSDVQLQARNTNGAAYQNSFDSFETKKDLNAKQKEAAHATPMAAPASPAAGAKMPTLASSATGGALAYTAAKSVPAVTAPEWKGDQSGITTFRTVIANTAEEWHSLWREHTQNIIPPPPIPEIDFTRSMVVGVFAGQKPSGGYSIEITGTQQPADVLVVTYKETAPAPDGVQTTVLTTPFHLKVIPQNNSLIQFKKQ